MDISNLSPEQQQTFLSLLSQSNQQSMDPSAFGASSAPAPTQQASQQPIAPAIQQQEGDKMHPMDAMSQIASQILPKAPPSGPQMTRGSDGRLSYQENSDNPLLKLFGVKRTVTTDGPDYYAAAKASGFDKYLPSGLAITPEGTPFLGPKGLEQARDNYKAAVGQGKEVYNTLDQLTSQGIPEDAARGLLAANVNGVTSKQVGNWMGNERMKDTHTIAEARATMAGVAALAQKLKVGGWDAAQPMAEAAVKNVGLGARAQATIDQIVQSGGKANKTQRASLSADLAQIAGNSQGVLTDQRMNEFMPDSAKGKFGTIYSYWTNENQPVDFTGFLPQLQDLLTKEVQANKGLASAATQLGINIMATTKPKTATDLANARNASPMFGDAPVSQTVTAPGTSPVTPKGSRIPAPTKKKIATSSDYLAKFGGH